MSQNKTNQNTILENKCQILEEAVWISYWYGHIQELK